MGNDLVFLVNIDRNYIFLVIFKRDGGYVNWVFKSMFYLVWYLYYLVNYSLYNVWLFLSRVLGCIEISLICMEFGMWVVINYWMKYERRDNFMLI